MSKRKSIYSDLIDDSVNLDEEPINKAASQSSFQNIEPVGVEKNKSMYAHLPTFDAISSVPTITRVDYTGSRDELKNNFREICKQQKEAFPPEYRTNFVIFSRISIVINLASVSLGTLLLLIKSRSGQLTFKDFFLAGVAPALLMILNHQLLMRKIDITFENYFSGKSDAEVEMYISRFRDFKREMAV